jgi:hypothetical protein
MISPLATLWYKMISSSMNVTVPKNFWEPVRLRVVENTIGYVPVMNSAGVVMSAPKSSAPIVTYISRQNGVRSFAQEAHDGLIVALRKLEEEGICQFDVVAMEDLAFSEQVEIVARTTVRRSLLVCVGSILTFSDHGWYSWEWLDCAYICILSPILIAEEEE